jgi:putative transposase
MRTSYKFRMYESSKNHRLHRLVTMATRIWNHAVAFQKTHYRLFKKHCNKFQLMKHIAKLRNRREDWQVVGSQCVQAVIGKLDLTYQAFFKWVKKRTGSKRGKPKFKRSSGHGSVVFKQVGWAYLGENRIRFGKHQYKFIKSREIEGKIKTCTLKRDSMNRFWVVFSCEKEDVQDQVTGSINTAGFDFGLKQFLTCSDGTTIESPQFFRSSMAEIAKCNRELAIKKKGSKNRRKAKYRFSRAHERIANRRTDWFFKLAHSLCDRFDTMYFETLNIAGMARLWGRKITDLAFSEFLEILKWVAYKRGKGVNQIGQWEPTTKTCSQCGHRQPMPLDVRVFDCGGCHCSVDRDLNAALNIKRAGHCADGLGSVSQDSGLAVSV